MDLAQISKILEGIPDLSAPTQHAGKLILFV